MATYDHFYETPVYRVLRSFRKKVSVLVKKYIPKGEYELRKQLTKSSRSLTANYAEGFGRFHYQENIQYCRQSRGSLTESLEHIITCFDEKYIPMEVLKEINTDYKKCLKEINGYVKYLKSAKQSDNN